MKKEKNAALRINDEEVIVFAANVADYANKFEPGYTKQITVYVKRNRKNEFADKIKCKDLTLELEGTVYKCRYFGMISGNSATQTVKFLLIAE